MTTEHMLQRRATVARWFSLGFSPDAEGKILVMTDEDFIPPEANSPAWENLSDDERASIELKYTRWLWMVAYKLGFRALNEQESKKIVDRVLRLDRWVAEQRKKNHDTTPDETPDHT